MKRVTSDLTLAGAVSSTLSQAASALTAVQAPLAITEGTTVAGNANVRKSNLELVAALQSIATN